MKPIINDIFGAALNSGLTRLGRRRLPQINGSLAVSGLSAPVEIIRDRWGVPHLYAKNEADLFFAQGFVHAQDRLWQMELNRRTATGRLSELFGPLALDTDRAARTFGFHRLAQTDWAEADEAVRRAVSAYSAGVNAFLTHPQSRWPVEFTLLRHRPEPWQPEETMSFLRLMAWQLSHAWYGTIVRAQLIEAVGAERAAEWEISYPAQHPVTLPHGIEFNRLSPDGSLHPARSPFLERGQGSNAWAVSGKRSVTGRPFLCNDAHLGLRTPSVWYQNHLVGGDFNVSGVSLPAGPMVMIGHNEQIAWGLTVAFTDCEDLFIEQFESDSSQKYRFREAWCEAEIISEPIIVKGQNTPHLEQVVITRHGPIISEVVGQPEQQLALNSMALRSASAMKAWWRLNRAQGWDDFVEAMRLIEAPQLNVVYADTAGNIGYWLTGRVPVRAKGDGSVPVPGWSGAYEWVGEVSFEAMPHSLNPASGTIVSCNHRVINDAYPHHLGNVWMNGYRAQRITSLLEEQPLTTPDLFRTMQLDFTSLPGQEFVGHLAQLPQPQADPDLHQALERLLAWDGQLTAESVAGALYQVTRYMLVRNLLEPALGQKLTKQLIGEGFNPVLLSTHEFYGYDTVSVLRMLDNPASWWISQAGGKEQVLRRSLKQAVVWLQTKLGREMDTWEWGRLHRVYFNHALGLKPPLDRIFSRGGLPIGGDTDTPCQTAMLPMAPYDSKGWGPSIRQIIDLSDFSRSVITAPPGQSGHIASPHYDDQLRPWLKGEYHPMLWQRTEIEREAEGKLVLH
ncbi:MAG: penicillin acylase family protein [Anaerolineae bacterium]|nr:penicillin acylase family protein [Anaerolineae bacterium]